MILNIKKRRLKPNWKAISEEPKEILSDGSFVFGNAGNTKINTSENWDHLVDAIRYATEGFNLYRTENANFTSKNRVHRQNEDKQE